MANKQTSFLAPFAATFLGVVVLGLCILYFGFYQKRIENYKTIIAQIENKPTPETALSFTVDDSGVMRGVSPEDQKLDEKDDVKKSPKITKPKAPAKKNREKSKVGEGGVKKADPLKKKQKPRRSRRSRPKSSPKKKADDDTFEEIPPIKRGPAFPSRNKGNTADSEESGSNEANESRDIPDINDPEMDDNPLIRALREASNRGQDNPRDPGEKPKNPFDAILNTQDN